MPTLTEVLAAEAAALTALTALRTQQAVVAASRGLAKLTAQATLAMLTMAYNSLQATATALRSAYGAGNLAPPAETAQPGQNTPWLNVISLGDRPQPVERSR